MDVSRFYLSVTLFGAPLVCEEMHIKREAAVAQITTVSNGVVSRKQGVKRRVITLKGKVVCDDFSAIQDALEQGLKTKTTVTVNTTEYENAEIYDYSIKLKAGEKLADVELQLYIDDE